MRTTKSGKTNLASSAVSLETFTHAVSQLLERRYALTLNDGMTEELLLAAYENGETPDELVEFVENKYGLTRVDLHCDHPLFCFCGCKN